MIELPLRFKKEKSTSNLADAEDSNNALLNETTYETDENGNFITKEGKYTGPKPNQSKKAKKALSKYKKDELDKENKLKDLFKKRKKYFMRGWYTYHKKTKISG